MANGNDTVLNSIRRGQLRNPVTGILGGLFDLVSAWNKDDEAQRNKKKVGERLKKELAKIGVSDIDEISTDGQVDWDKVEAARKRHEDEQAAATTQTQTGGTRNAGQTGGTQTAAQPTSPSTPALNPATGAKRALAPTRAPLVSVGRNDRTGTTITVNGQGMRPTTENQNIVTELQRRQLLDAPTGVDVISPLYTNAEVRLMRRQAAQDQMFRDRQDRLQKIWDRSVARSNETAWARGAVRNEDDWRHYGEVASAEGWKKGEEAYNNMMAGLRGKIGELLASDGKSGLADQGLLHANETELRTDVNGRGYVHDLGNPRQRLDRLVRMIDSSDSGAGLSQKQAEVANAQLDRFLATANKRKELREGETKQRARDLRREYGLPDGVSDTDVLKYDRAQRASAVKSSLAALRDPEVANSAAYWDHIDTLQRNGAGLSSAFNSAMKDPETLKAYMADQAKLDATHPGDFSRAMLQSRYAIAELQRQQDLAAPVQPNVQPALTDEEKRRLGIQAAQGAGDALRPRRKGVA